jgi:hypothetical protein
MPILTLMNRTHPVCDLEYDPISHIFIRILRSHDEAAYAPIAILEGKTISQQRLNRWWGARAIPQSRPGIQKTLSALDMSDPVQLLEKNHGLSLSDQYWMREVNGDTRWEDINYFNNPFSDEVGRLLFGEEANRGKGDLNAPDNSSDGNLPKRWIIKEGTRILLKGGSMLNQEPYNELIATKLYRRLLDSAEYVPYSLHTEKGRVYSACAEMLSDDEEYVPALYVNDLLPYEDRPEPKASLEHFIHCCECLGIRGAERQLSKMLVGDYLVANFDRHWRNFGLIRNVNTLTWHFAPLFDSGSCLWCTTIPLREDNLTYVSQPFVQDPDLQLSLVEDYSWFDLSRLFGFVEEVIGILRDGPLADYAVRLTVIEDALYARLDRLIDQHSLKSCQGH